MEERQPKSKFGFTSVKQTHDARSAALRQNQTFGSEALSQVPMSQVYSTDSGIERPESPTLPPESSQGEDYTELVSTPRTTDYTVSAPTSPLRGGYYNGSSNSSSVSMAMQEHHGQPLSPSASHGYSSASINSSGNSSQTTSFLTERAPQSQMNVPVPMSQPPSRKHSSTSANRLRHASSSGTLHHSRSKRSQFMSDHVAAAIELSSANPNIPAAPAAGMYWSRTVTYGRGPSRPLRAHTANLIGELLYVFGGCDPKTCFNTLYILDMDTLTWSKPRTYGQVPPACRAHSCTVVERETSPGKRTHQLYIFGGGDGPNYFNDMYVLHAETLTWSKPVIEGTPPSPRRAHTTCLWNDKIIVVGGGDGARALADVHALDVSDPKKLRWTLLNPTGTPPIARGYHTSNLVKDKLVVYGGSDGHECFSDVHVLDLVANRWSHIDLDRAVPRLAHTATQVGSYVFVIGGHDGSRYSSDVLLLNLVTMSWESRKIYGVAPNPRGYHTSVLHDSRLYILGGYDGKNVFDDVYMLELSACAYLPQITNFEIDV